MNSSIKYVLIAIALMIAKKLIDMLFSWIASHVQKGTIKSALKPWMNRYLFISIFDAIVVSVIAYYAGFLAGVTTVATGDDLELAMFYSTAFAIFFVDLRNNWLKAIPRRNAEKS